MTRIVLVRHGETDWNRNGLIQGRQPVGLNETGRRQMKSVSKSLPKLYEDIVAVISSPLLRATQSAHICATSWLVPLGVLHEFSERSFGNLEGLSKSDLALTWSISDVEGVTGANHGMEPMDQVRARVLAGVHQLHAHYPTGTVVVITHGSIIRIVEMDRGNHPDIIRNGGFIVL